MMLVMFSVGVMNVAWMAGLAAAMTIEKLLTGQRFAHGVGVVLIVVGTGISASAFAAHWH
jgi:predicted metal-binding membrane protein